MLSWCKKTLITTDIIDHMYPKIKIDLVLIQGTFTPETVRMISTRFRVPLSFMFIQCPSKDFPYLILSFVTSFFIYLEVYYYF